MFKLNVRISSYQHASPICHEYYQHHHDSTQTHQKTYQHGKIKGNVLYATVKKVSLWITPPIIQAW